MLICMRTTLNLDDELVAAAKQRAAEESRTLTSIVEDGLRAVLHGQREPRPRVVLPTSGGDGPATGLDLDDWSAVRDRLDEDEDGGYRAAASDAAP
jgi:plasmid stability protein